MELHVHKITRCSTENDLVADYLSKDRVGRARSLVKLVRERKPAEILVGWLANPSPTRMLGKKLLSSIEDDGISVLWHEPRDFC